MRVDQVHTIGPASVGAFGGISEFVEYSRKFDSQLANTGSSNEGPVFFILGAGEHNFVFDVALHLPDITGMGLGNVHHKKCDAILVLIVELVEGGNLPPEWRSGITAENQDRGLLLSDFGELDASALVQLH